MSNLIHFSKGFSSEALPTVRERELFQLLEGAGDAVFVVDQGGLIRYWNPSAEQLLGVRAPDALLRHCAAVLEGADSAGGRVCTPDCAIMEISRRNTQVSAYDLEVRTASGARKWVNVSVIVARTGPKKAQLLIHLVRDIDTRKRLENLTKEIAVHVGHLTHLEADELVASARSPVPTLQLTAQERRILQLLSQGRNTAAVGRELHISPATVRNHVQHVLKKLGAHTRLEAVLRATRERMI